MILIPPTIVFIVLIPLVCVMIIAYKCITLLMHSQLVIQEEMLYL
jgi:hypothetical protein